VNWISRGAIVLVPSRNGSQESIYRQLWQLNPSLAELYEGARQMLAADAAPSGWSQFVPHAVREISARVPDLIRGVSDARLDYTARLDRLARLWQRQGLSTDSVEVSLTSSADNPGATADLPIQVVAEVTKLLHEHLKSRAETLRSRLEEAARLRARSADQSWLARWAREWHRSHTWAQAHAHVGERSTEPSLDDYRSEFARFERTLAGILGDYVTNKDELDALLAATNEEPWSLPTDTQVSEALRLVARPEEQRYFFDRLRNPYWLDALRVAGALIPPNPIVTDDGVRYPGWPISAYIGRTAASHPDHLAIAGLIQPLLDTKDISIQRDLLEAMANLTPSSLTELLGPVSAWPAEMWRISWIGDRLNEVIVNAARDETNVPALQLILDAIFEPYWREPDAVLGERASSRISEWDARQFAAGIIPQLVDLSPLLLLSPLIRKLRAVLERQRSDATEVLGYKDDHSVIWYPDLGGGDLPHDAADVLTYLLVSLLDRLSHLPEVHQDVLQALGDGGWVIHERLMQRFLAATIETQGISEEVVGRLQNPDAAGAYQTRRESDDLLARAFRHLDEHGRASVLDALRVAAARQGEEAERWLYQRLSHVSDDLPGEVQVEFDGWRERFGEVVPTEFLTVATWTGPHSPLDSEAAAAMSAPDLVAYAREWDPPEGGMLFERPSWEGLSAAIRVEVAQRPSEFSSNAPEFVDCDPTIVNGFLRGLADAVQANRNIDWEPVLALIRDIAPLSEEPLPDRVARLEGDPSWAWAKMQAVELLEAAFQSESSLGLEHRAALQDTLLALADGCEPPDITDRDPTNVSVNAARSRVVYATISYLFWLRRNGVRGMPEEVGEFLNTILDQDRESFVGMRAAVAHQLPQLAFVDPEWTVEALPAVFVEADEHWDAAWRSYLMYARPLPASPVIESLEPYYRRAVERIDPDHEIGDSHGDPVVRLGEHIVFMVLNGLWTIDQDIVRAYFAKAPIAVRLRVMDWIGRGAKQDEPTAEWCERARSFFEWRERALAELDEDASELRPIGWLVASNQFPVEWWVTRLPAILRSTGAARHTYLPLEEMMGRVAGAAADHPESALEVLETVVDQSEWERHEPYLIAAEQILDLAIRREELQHRARQVADRLARAGHDQFGRYAG